LGEWAVRQRGKRELKAGRGKAELVGAEFAQMDQNRDGHVQRRCKVGSKGRLETTNVVTEEKKSGLGAYTGTRRNSLNVSRGEKLAHGNLNSQPWGDESQKKQRKQKGTRETERGWGQKNRSVLE